jgi:hypothetical protein
MRGIVLGLSLVASMSVWAQDIGGVARFHDAIPQRESSSNPDLYSNGDARSIKMGDTLVLGELEGPGAITHMWCTVGAYDPFFSRSLVVRIYWDGAENPSVEAPLGDFFGVGYGAFADFTSAPVSVSSHGRARTFYWRMPFKKSAKVTVTNESHEFDVDSFYYYLDWEKTPTFPDDALYFHARYRQAHPAQPGDYTILETKGRGQYVGTVYSALSTEIGWFGEGDDRFFIDGETEPSLRGTGTEDYFSDAWGFRPFNKPQYGVSLWEGYFPGDRVTAYRWHISDPIPFHTSLKMSIEHRGSVFTDNAQHLGQFFERADWISSVAFWYQTPAVGFEQRIPPAEERMPPYRVLRMDQVEVETKPKGITNVGAEGLTYLPMKGDGKVNVTFDVKEPGRYQVNAVIYHSFYGGLYQASVDGEPVGEVLNLNQTGSDPVWTRFDLHDFEVGKHTLSFEGQGTPAATRTMAPKADSFQMVYLILLRMEDVEGYHKVLNEQLEKRKKK